MEQGDDVGPLLELGVLLLQPVSDVVVVGLHPAHVVLHLLQRLLHRPRDGRQVGAVGPPELLQLQHKFCVTVA